MSGPKIDQVVAAYIKLRDEKALLKAKYDAAKEGVEEQMAQLEAYLLAKSLELGVDSFKAKDGAGTAYRYEETSATVADWDTTLPFIQKNGLWTLLERRVSKKAVEEFRKEHNAVPPGINFSSCYKIGVRRS